MKLASILNEEMIFFNVKGLKREEIYQNMLEMAVNEINCDINVEEATKSIIEREDTSGMIYDSVAMPHVRLPHLDDLYIIIGVLDEPTKIMPNDLVSSKLVIMSLISDNTSDIYLKSIASFAKFFRDTEHLAELIAKKDAKSFKDYLNSNNVKLKNDITAEDLMTNPVAVLSLDDALSKALDIFNKNNVSVLPVVDKNNKFLGVIDANTVIRKFVPEYIFMMENLNFLNSFEAFERIFKEENIETIENFMNEPKYICKDSTPLIQLTVEILRNEIKKIFVVNDNNELVGEISIKNIIHRVLRG